MKIHGKKIEGVNIEICVIPRGENESIVFRCQAVLDMDAFDKLCPEPKPPTVLKPGNKRIPDLESGSYKSALEQHGRRRVAYLVLKSLEATEGLTWETIQMGDPSTWQNYEKELQESGFSNIEVMRIINSCMAANCLDESRIERARDDFLASQRVESNGKSSPMDEPLLTPSGKRVKDLL